MMLTVAGLPVAYNSSLSMATRQQHAAHFPTVWSNSPKLFYSNEIKHGKYFSFLSMNYFYEN